jgi:hypothetical protein
MARNWRKVRTEAVATGQLNPNAVADARTTLDDAVHAYRLAEVRKA